MKTITSLRKRQWIEITARELCWERASSKTRDNCMKLARERWEQGEHWEQGEDGQVVEPSKQGD